LSGPKAVGLGRAGRRGVAERPVVRVEERHQRLLRSWVRPESRGGVRKGASSPGARVACDRCPQAGAAKVAGITSFWPGITSDLLMVATLRSGPSAGPGDDHRVVDASQLADAVDERRVVVNSGRVVPQHGDDRVVPVVLAEIEAGVRC